MFFKGDTSSRFGADGLYVKSPGHKLFFCQLPHCADAIVAAQVTQELVCVLCVCELVFCLCVYLWAPFTLNHPI